MAGPKLYGKMRTIKMSEITIRQIDQAHKEDIRLPNQPFTIWGRMVPSLDHGQWNYTIEKFPQTSQDCFPNENYDLNAPGTLFLGAYQAEKCVGLAVLRTGMQKYLYLDDLKVNRACRGQGIGGQLIQACLQVAKKRQLQGMYTIGQDTNLSACLFYLKQGFEIGGFDNRVYGGTSQEKAADIYFYQDIKA